MKTYLIKEIVHFLGKMPYTIHGNSSTVSITKAAETLEADSESIVWISPKRSDKQKLAENTRAGIVICDATTHLTELMQRQRCFVVVNNPRLAFTRIAKNLFVSNNPPFIHPTSIINDNAVLGDGVTIHPYAVIGNCSIGSGTVIGAHCCIYDNVQIHSNVKIEAGTIIGADGFGFEKNEEGIYEGFPHLGGVLIEDNVEIGANVCIDRGALRNTIIRRNTKIDNLVHISHNVTIGENVLIIAESQIAGSVIIEDGVWIAPSVTIINNIHIGKNAFIGIGSVVVRDVESNQRVFGNPAKIITTPPIRV